MALSLIGKTLANYHVQRQLGQGGMATVYYAMDTSLDRPVAIKVIDARFQDDPEYARRFVEEAKIIARWRNNNIVQVYYAGQEDDIYFFAMEYIEGASLAELIDDYSAMGELMPHDDVLRIGRAIAGALDYAHQQDVIHRDVKPQNVMIGYDDRVVLMDFGLALDVQQGTMGTIFGTPHYISPEQARSSADVVPSSDIYSLAVILYEMLTGDVPFDDPSAATLALQHLSVPPPAPRSLNPELPPAVDEVLLRALAKDADARYESGVALVEELEKALTQPEAEDDIANSMPLPPAMVGGGTSRRMSQMSVSERIALKIENNPEPTVDSVAPPTAPPTRTKPARTVRANPPTPKAKAKANNRGILVASAVGLLLIVVILGGFLFSRGGEDATPLPTAAVLAVETLEVVFNTIEPNNNSNAVQETTTALAISFQRMTDEAPTQTNQPTNTPEPIATETNTVVPPTATNTSVPPSATPIPQTNTVIPPTNTNIPPTAIPNDTPIPHPTVLYPNGRRMLLLWNDVSFYAANQSGASFRVSQIRFEALRADGSALPYSFDASEWTRFFSSIENNKCDTIEITNSSSWLRPGQCRDYNAFTTLTDGDNRIFWLPRDGMTQFRVLYNNQEIARCDITAQECPVLLPPE